jgi:tetratricopeptide (TPR) repeat protein
VTSLEIKQIKDLRAQVEFDGGEWTAEFKNPFTPQQEEELRWYFEQHLEFPMLESQRAEQAAASIKEYGHTLFNQLFSDAELLAAFRKHHSDEVRIDISGDPEFHRLHWETLWSPHDPNPLAYRTVITRRAATRNVPKIDLEAGPAIRVLVVVSRPAGDRDVGYRTISRPLVETLHQASLAVELDFVRPGTWEQLRKHLADKPKGYYHVLHFDGHGAVAAVAEIERLRKEGKLLFNADATAGPATGKGRMAFLFFEGSAEAGHGEGVGHAIAAAEVADLVNDSQIPVVILNACQSGKQESEPETNLASRLAQAGVGAVLGMGYSVTVSAARHFMEAFYREVFDGRQLSQAVTRARQRLDQDKRRDAYFGLQVDLEDWMLPVFYENGAVQLQVRATADEERAILKRRAESFEARPLKHHFWGRDLDVLSIERRVLGAADRNILLIEGMGGTGKTALLQHLGWWWQATGLVSRVFNFEYDRKPWTRQQILFDIARQLDLRLNPEERLQQEAVATRLRSERFLLVLDNLESVTGEQLAIGQSLPEAERRALRELLRKLRGGKTLVLVGSRSKEEWLSAGTFDTNVHPLRGLDREAGSSFADEILRAAGADPSRIREIRAIPKYRELLDLLGGHPLAMQVILSNLAAKDPAEVLHALRQGDVQLDRGETRTDSIIKCIDYSHSNLSPDARELLQCLAPFTGVVFLPAFDEYVQLLRAQPELSGLPWDKMPKVLAEAERWGLARTEGDSFLRLQPVFPYFLRSRADSGRGAAVETAFREHYQGLCGMISSLQTSKKPEERQAGQRLAKLEYENALRALDLSLAARSSIAAPYIMLSQFFDDTKDSAAGLALAERVGASLERYPERLLAGPLGLEMVGVIDDAAKRFLTLKRYPQAKAAYERALAILRSNASIQPEQQRKISASIYHQLGRVAEEQRQWKEAEKNYREALRIFVEFNDRYEQARTYHQLGSVAQEQRQWAEAEKNYREALRIKAEFNDRYAQASTYHQLGRVAEEQRQWAEAEKSYREALRIYVEFNDRYAQASTYHQLGIVAQQQRQREEAEKNYREALRIYVEFNDRYSQAGTYHQLGRVAQEQRQWEEAEKNYREALRIYVEFNDPLRAGWHVSPVGKARGRASAMGGSGEKLPGSPPDLPGIPRSAKPRHHAAEPRQNRPGMPRLGG